MRRPRRILLLLALWSVVPGGALHADSIVTPFVGVTFGAETAFLTLDPDAITSKNVVFGGNWLWLTDRIFGVEGDVALAPGFFEGRNAQNLVTSSRVTTLFGSIITAVPVSVSREGLRPYLAGGLGLVQVKLEDIVGLVNSDNSLGLQLGGGAIGFVTNRTGVRFDLRYVRSLDRTTDEITLDRRSKLSFWRASVGVAIRY